jgi:uncharacterized membrane protein YhaH (DUF805 family)
MSTQIYFRFSSYLLRKPYLFVILTAIGWFIISIQSDLYDIINMAVKTAEVDEQKTKYLQHFINKYDTIVSN